VFNSISHERAPAKEKSPWEKYIEDTPFSSNPIKNNIEPAQKKFYIFTECAITIAFLPLICHFFKLRPCTCMPPS